MKKILLLIFILSLFGIHLNAQVNADTPNLDFSYGNFNNWNICTGNYVFNPTDYSFSYGWTPITGSSSLQEKSRIILIPGGTNMDPLIFCDLPMTPFGTRVARIGVPLACEKQGTDKTSAAELMTYKFVATEKTTLLTFRLAAVMRAPSGDHDGPEQRPTFAVNVRIVDKNGMESIADCSNYSSSADKNSFQLIKKQDKG